VLFSSQFFRVFTTDDVAGVEVGSALKNVLAIATGVVKGLGYGPNAQMALVTRGWADIRRLSRSYGAREETMTGLAGIGDVMLTCFGGLSRNYRFGQRLAETGDIQIALDEAGGTVEG
jgi:glycerol-3-phosphate dehydrogenase (NAD(P)+)